MVVLSIGSEGSVMVIVSVLHSPLSLPTQQCPNTRCPRTWSCFGHAAASLSTHAETARLMFRPRLHDSVTSKSKSAFFVDIIGELVPDMHCLLSISDQLLLLQR